jgi:hypothetical protein
VAQAVKVLLVGLRQTNGRMAAPRKISWPEIPRKGDFVIVDDRSYLVTTVVWDTDASEILVNVSEYGHT